MPVLASSVPLAARWWIQQRRFLWPEAVSLWSFGPSFSAFAEEGASRSSCPAPVRPLTLILLPRAPDRSALEWGALLSFMLQPLSEGRGSLGTQEPAELDQHLGAGVERGRVRTGFPEERALPLSLTEDRPGGWGSGLVGLPALLPGSPRFIVRALWVLPAPGAQSTPSPLASGPAATG